MAEDKKSENQEKRGPGRPRRHPLLEAMATEPPKRKRGRPRKNPLPDASQADQPKRKRGRPRKNPVPDAAPEPPPAEPIEEVAPVESAKPAEEVAPEPEADAEMEQEAAVIELVATKRKRGRPRKKPLPESTPANQHRKPSVVPSLRRPITDEDIHRLRTRELAGALDYELRAFEEVIEDFLAEIEEDFTLQIAAFRAELRRKARESGKGADSPSTSRVLQKAALRLAKFRNAENVTLEDLSRFQRRLEKLIDRLRRA